MGRVEADIALESWVLQVWDMGGPRAWGGRVESVSGCLLPPPASPGSVYVISPIKSHQIG